MRMGREIKFRAWSDKLGMRQLDQITMGDKSWSCEGGNGVSLIYQPHIIVMQFCNCKDRKEKEAYESDRIAFYYWRTYEQRSFPEYVDFIENDLKKVTGVIYWNDEFLQWYVRPDEKYPTTTGDGYNGTMDDIPLAWVGAEGEDLLKEYNEEREESEKLKLEDICGFEVVGNIYEHSHLLTQQQ